MLMPESERSEWDGPEDFIPWDPDMSAAGESETQELLDEGSSEVEDYFPEEV